MACPLEAAARKTQDDRDLSGHLLRSGNAEAASGACWHVGLVAHQVFIGIGPNIPKIKVMNEGALWCIFGCASLLFKMRRFFSYVYLFKSSLGY